MFSMTAASGAPQVRPSGLSPETMRGASGSLRGVPQGSFPGARRATKAERASRSTGSPEGSPSTTHPTAGECDWPNTVTLSAVPNEDGITAPF